MCWYEQFPAVKWFSNSDVSSPDLGLTCSRVDHPPPGGSWKSFAELWKLTRLIDGWPW